MVFLVSGLSALRSTPLISPFASKDIFSASGLIVPFISIVAYRDVFACSAIGLSFSGFLESRSARLKVSDETIILSGGLVLLSRYVSDLSVSRFNFPSAKAKVFSVFLPGDFLASGFFSSFVFFCLFADCLLSVSDFCSHLSNSQQPSLFFETVCFIPSRFMLLILIASV